MNCIIPPLVASIKNAIILYIFSFEIHSLLSKKLNYREKAVQASFFPNVLRLNQHRACEAPEFTTFEDEHPRCSGTPKILNIRADDLSA